VTTTGGGAWTGAAASGTSGGACIGAATGLPEKYAAARFENSHVRPRAPAAPPIVAARPMRMARSRVASSDLPDITCLNRPVGVSRWAWDAADAGCGSATAAVWANWREEEAAPVLPAEGGRTHRPPCGRVAPPGRSCERPGARLRAEESGTWLASAGSRTAICRPWPAIPRSGQRRGSAGCSARHGFASASFAPSRRGCLQTQVA
jgi:hypothetical protein